MDVERQECRRARYEEGQTAHDTAQRGADHRLHLRRIARDARDQRARAERIDLLHRQMHDALETVLADVVAEILRTEIDTDGSHDATEAAEQDNQDHREACLRHEWEVRHATVIQAQHTFIDDGLHQARLIEVDEDLADHEGDRHYRVDAVRLDVLQHSSPSV